MSVFGGESVEDEVGRRRPALPVVVRFQTRPRDARRAARARVTPALAMSEYRPPVVSTRPTHLGRSEKSRVARREALALVAELDSFIRLKSTRAANLVRDTRVGLDAAAPSADANAFPPGVDLARLRAFDPDPATRRRRDPLEPSDAPTAAESASPRQPRAATTRIRHPRARRRLGARVPGAHPKPRRQLPGRIRAAHSRPARSHRKPLAGRRGSANTPPLLLHLLLPLRRGRARGPPRRNAGVVSTSRA